MWRGAALGVLCSRMTRDWEVIQGGHVVLIRARIGAPVGVCVPRTPDDDAGRIPFGQHVTTPFCPRRHAMEHEIRRCPLAITRPGLRPLRPRLGDMPCHASGAVECSMPVPTDTHGAPRPHVPSAEEARTPAHISAPASPLSSRSSPPARDSSRLLVLVLWRMSFVLGGPSCGCIPGEPCHSGPCSGMQLGGRWDAGTLGPPAALVMGFPSRVPDTRRRFPFPRLQNLHWRPASLSHAVLDVADSATPSCYSRPGR